MTREKMGKLILPAIKKGIQQGFTPEQITEGALNRIEFGMEQEMDAADGGLVFDLPSNGEPPRESRPALPATMDTDYLRPATPAAAGTEGVSVIRDSPSLPAVPAVEPIRLGPRRPEVDEHLILRRHWRLSGAIVKGQEHLPSLQQHVIDNTPETITVRPGSKPITLVRAVDIQPGIEQVRVSYRLGVESDTQPSMKNSSAGETLAAISIDTPVMVNFSCYDRDPDIAGKMEQVQKNAEHIYRPRPAELGSSMPRRMGHLGVSSEDPHDEVGEMANPINGKVW